MPIIVQRKNVWKFVFTVWNYFNMIRMVSRLPFARHEELHELLKRTEIIYKTYLQDPREKERMKAHPSSCSTVISSQRRAGIRIATYSSSERVEKGKEAGAEVGGWKEGEGKTKRNKETRKRALSSAVTGDKRDKGEECQQRKKARIITLREKDSLLCK